MIYAIYSKGACGSSHDMLLFLSHLTNAYRSLEGSGPISHDTAVLMLHGSDKGSVEFMGAKMGLGVFTIEADQNKFAVHHGMLHSIYFIFTCK